MASLYNGWLVGLSLIVGVLASYTALRLAARVARSEASGLKVWLGFGALAMGIGIWSMHFIGMLALSLPISLNYDLPTTLASLMIAVTTSGFALTMTRGPHLTLSRLGASSVLMGAGISAMHYTGMAAITIVPSISYDALLVAISILIAIAASFVALWLFFRLRDGHSVSRWFLRMTAALVMGFAMCGMHYTAMSAARFALGAFCRGGVTLHNTWLAATIGVFALGFLVVTLVTAIYESRLQSRSRRHAQRLSQAEVQLDHQRTHDALTGLPNRVLFFERLGEEIDHAEREGGPFAILAVNLDRFKVLNDTLGHRAGDQLLSEVARRLSGVVRAGDLVARTGGDEFLVLMTEPREASEVAEIATKIGAELGQRVSLGVRCAHTSASIGISLYPADGTDADTLVAHADAAMVFAKQSGHHAVQFFHPGMRVSSHERLDLENDLRYELLLQQFEVHYQPKIDLGSGRMNSVEALLRWRHPTRGLVGPNDSYRLPRKADSCFPLMSGCCGKPVAKRGRGSARGSRSFESRSTSRPCIVDNRSSCRRYARRSPSMTWTPDTLKSN